MNTVIEILQLWTEKYAYRGIGPGLCSHGSVRCASFATVAITTYAISA